MAKDMCRSECHRLGLRGSIGDVKVLANPPARPFVEFTRQPCALAYDEFKIGIEIRIILKGLNDNLKIVRRKREALHFVGMKIVQYRSWIASGIVNRAAARQH